MTIRIGTSGWSYDHWQGILYPAGIPQIDRLIHYVKHFNTVEVNSTFYRWPADAAFVRWRTRVPADFCMTVKAPRGLTHGQRLYAPERWLSRVEEGMQGLGDKQGVLLVQVPPDFSYDYARLEYFLVRLPITLRVAIEFRHHTWHQEAVWQLLERLGVAYCIMSGGRLPCILRATAPFVYVRLHGPDPHHLYAGKYTDEDLHWWATRIREWDQQRRDVFAYFNNDGFGHAVYNAATLRSMLNA